MILVSHFVPVHPGQKNSLLTLLFHKIGKIAKGSQISYDLVLFGLPKLANKPYFEELLQIQ